MCLLFDQDGMRHVSTQGIPNRRAASPTILIMLPDDFTKPSFQELRSNKLFGDTIAAINMANNRTGMNRNKKVPKNNLSNPLVRSLYTQVSECICSFAVQR
jgi:hypothetical protein